MLPAVAVIEGVPRLCFLSGTDVDDLTDAADLVPGGEEGIHRGGDRLVTEFGLDDVAAVDGGDVADLAELVLEDSVVHGVLPWRWRVGSYESTFCWKNVQAVAGFSLEKFFGQGWCNSSRFIRKPIRGKATLQQLWGRQNFGRQLF